jgi:hypothetical protein
MKHSGCRGVLHPNLEWIVLDGRKVSPPGENFNNVEILSET